MTIHQLYPSKQDRDRVAEQSGAVEGGRQHLQNLENYIREHLA